MGAFVGVVLWAVNRYDIDEEVSDLCSSATVHKRRTQDLAFGGAGA